MFPWVDGFHWTFGHILFLSLFFAVVTIITATLLSAIGRTMKNLRTASPVELCWKSDFAELPEAERRCRHELAGRVESRTCDNAFDCRRCTKYADFAALPAAGMAHDLGLKYASDRLYHRGHTWLQTNEDGTITVGLDELAEHLVGKPDSIRMPAVGERIELNGTAWRMTKNGNEIRVRAPIEGEIVELGGPTSGFYLKIRPQRDPKDPVTLRHLLRGPEVRWWLSRELERLQLQLRTPNSAPSLADGGVLVDDLMDAMPEADWNNVLASTFLES